MKKVLQFFLMLSMMAGACGCSKDDDGPDDNTIWDISPSVLVIELEDEEENNLLDPDVAGNWVGQSMWIGHEDKAYDIIWNKEDIMPETRYYMPHFYGAVWSGLSPYEKVPYYIYFGQFAGDQNRDMKLTFGIMAINTVYQFEFSHRLVWKKKEPHFDDHITYRGERIDGPVLKLVVPKNPYSEKAN